MKSKVLLVALSAAVLASCGAGSSRIRRDGARTHLDELRHGHADADHIDPRPRIAGAPGTPGLVHPEEGSYIIVAGDYPSTIASTVQGRVRRPPRHQRLDAGRQPGSRVPCRRHDDQDPAGLDRARRGSQTLRPTPRSGTHSDRDDHDHRRWSVGMRARRVHDPGRRHHPIEGRQEARHHGRGTRRGQRQHQRVTTSFYPGPEDQDPAEGRTASHTSADSPDRV